MSHFNILATMRQQLADDCESTLSLRAIAAAKHWLVQRRPGRFVYLCPTVAISFCHPIYD
jgi:hypothetical protein